MTGSTERRSPLAGWAARFDAASARPEAFSIREIPFACQLNLRGDPSNVAFAGPVALVLGGALPREANTVSESNTGAALWLGPDEWLIVAAESRNQSLSAVLSESLPGVHHALTDVSASRTVIEISGEHARLVLAKGCPLDLHGARFPPGQCAQSLLAKTQVILQCVDVRPTFRIYVRNSFAAYLADWLTDAAAETAASVNIDLLLRARKLG